MLRQAQHERLSSSIRAGSIVEWLVVLIDSSLVVYREPDMDKGGFSHDVKDAFYRSIAEEFQAAQVIIFENDDPPSDIVGQSNNGIAILYDGHHEDAAEDF